MNKNLIKIKVVRRLRVKSKVEKQMAYQMHRKKRKRNLAGIKRLSRRGSFFVKNVKLKRSSDWRGT